MHKIFLSTQPQAKSQMTFLGINWWTDPEMLKKSTMERCSPPDLKIHHKATVFRTVQWWRADQRNRAQRPKQTHIQLVFSRSKVPILSTSGTGKTGNPQVQNINKTSSLSPYLTQKGSQIVGLEVRAQTTWLLEENLREKHVTLG